MGDAYLPSLLLLAIVTIGESLLANRHLSSPLRTG